MKILSIRLKNLASLAGEHFIDFESDPLASAGLIAIVGKTGAGKSTILDAMCLALFNKIPRLKDSDGKLQDVDGSELLTNSPLTVLRRGTAHGFAELCFVAQDQKHYLARWEIKRARENVSGKLQSVQRYLKCLTDGVIIADKSKAVETHIQQITQLTFEQFTRAVLLAQSEVTAFLKARDHERGELLEYLTNSAIFAKIGQLAFEKTKEIAQQRKQLENVLGHIELLSEQEFIALRLQFDTAKQQCQVLENKKLKQQQLHQWFERKDKIDQEVELKSEHYQLTLKAEQEAQPERELLNQLSLFSQIRPHIFQEQQLLNSQKRLEPQIDQQQQLFSSLKTQFEQQQVAYQHAENALAQFQNFEHASKAELNQIRQAIQEREYIAAEYKRVKTKLVQLDASRQPLLSKQEQFEQQLTAIHQAQQHLTYKLNQSSQFSPLDQGINAHLQQLAQFVEHYQSTQTVIGDMHLAKNKLQSDQAELAALIQDYRDSEQLETHIDQQHNLKDQQLNQLSLLESTQHKLKFYLELQQDLAQLKANLDTQAQALPQLKQETLVAKQNYQTAKLEREKLQQILQQQRLLHSENIEHLRAELQHGAPCLVCGSTEHPYRDDTVLSKALYALQQQQEQTALHIEQQHLERWQSAEQQQTQLEAELKQLEHSFNATEAKFNQQQQTLLQALQETKVQLDLSAQSTQLLEQLKLAIQASIAIKTNAEQQIQKLQQVHKKQQQLKQSIQTRLHHLHSIEQHQQQMQHIAKCLSTEQQQQWQQNTLRAAEQLSLDLKARAQALSQLEAQAKEQDQIQQQLNSLKADLLHLDKQLLELKQQLQALEQQGRDNSQKANDLIQQISGETKLKAAEWLVQHEQRRQDLQQHYHTNKQSFEQARLEFEQQKTELDRIKTQHQHNQSSLLSCQNEIKAWQIQHPDFDVQQFDVLINIPSQQEQQIRIKLQALEQNLSEAQAALKILQAQLHDHMQFQPDVSHEELQSALQQLQIQMNEALEQHDQYKLKLQLHQQNLIKQQQFAEQIQRIQQQEHRWNKISSLIGDAKGKEFRDYAQQYNLDILLEYANQQLAMLSQRYTLKRLEHSLSLAIIDHDMDGETRSTASLSGGESFLTALAISLAIANMASGSMKIESLFIDEGFGTLDASSLHMVMNALDQLQSQGRKVVLISHIQEMHERIPVQIQVQPLGSGSSQIHIMGQALLNV